MLKEGVGQRLGATARRSPICCCSSRRKPSPASIITLASYVEAMPAEQKEIYYLIGESRELLEHSPYLEAFRAKGQDVLLLTDPIDEFAIPRSAEYKGKKLQAADRGELAAPRTSKPADDEHVQGLCWRISRSKLDEVSDVRLSKRLTESAAVSGRRCKGAMTAHMERLMQRMGRGGDVRRRSGCWN